MRIKNDFIIIQNGKKQIKLHNTILNTYISKIINNQLTTDPDERASLIMNYAYLKFDSSLEFDKESNLQESDFDLKVIYYTTNTDISPKTIVNNYFYKVDNSQYTVYDISSSSYITDLSNYVGKKITAIGFGGNYQAQGIIYACVDTSNYNVYIEDTNTIFSIARRDIISTDSIFYTPNNVKGPIHLSDGQYHYDGGFPDYQLVGILDSVGLGLNSYKMDIGISLNPYVEHIDVETNKIQLLDELVIEHYSDGLFPDLDLYPSTEVYPARIIQKPLYPSNDIYPGIEVYMLESPYQYIQLKYKVYKIDTIDGTTTDTGDYYLLSNLIGDKEKIKMNIEYEEA